MQQEEVAPRFIGTLVGMSPRNGYEREGLWQERGTERKDRMARVFRGKVAIPGEQLDVYLEALGQFERDKAPLRTQLAVCWRLCPHSGPAVCPQNGPQTHGDHCAVPGVHLLG